MGKKKGKVQGVMLIGRLTSNAKGVLGCVPSKNGLFLVCTLIRVCDALLIVDSLAYGV